MSGFVGNALRGVPASEERNATEGIPYSHVARTGRKARRPRGPADASSIENRLLAGLPPHTQAGGPIALGYVHRELMVPDTRIELEDGRMATVLGLPFGSRPGGGVCA